MITQDFEAILRKVMHAHNKGAAMDMTHGELVALEQLDLWRTKYIDAENVDEKNLCIEEMVALLAQLKGEIDQRSPGRPIQPPFISPLSR